MLTVKAALDRLQAVPSAAASRSPVRLGDFVPHTETKSPEALVPRVAESNCPSFKPPDAEPKIS
jgi:hypothetical protein